MTFGAVTALLMLAAVAFGVMFAYHYFSTDHERAALIRKVKTACGNGRGVYRDPPRSMSVLQQMGYIERQRDGIADCAEAKLRVIQHDMSKRD